MFERRYFILAPNFHGATLLAKLLNAHPCAVSLGDTYPSNRFDQICGCGKRVSECAYWQAVKKRVEAHRYRSFPNLLPNYPTIVGSTVDKYLYNMLSPKALGQLTPSKRKGCFVDDFQNFLEMVHALEKSSEASVLVDGVKSVSRVVALLAAGEKVDGVIHLVRAPGDYAKSSAKQKGQSWLDLIRSVLGWRLYHRRARRLAKYVPYLPVHYEALAEDTDKVLGEVFQFLGLEPKSTWLLRSNLVATWHFMGNASLLEFDGTIRRSRHHLDKRERVLVRFLAGKPISR